MTDAAVKPTAVVAAVLHRPKEILILRRGPEQSGAGFWEFPGGKVEVGESPEQALRREILEELGIEIQVESFVGEVVHDYGSRKIRLSLYWARPLQQQLVLSDHDAFEWLAPQNVEVEKLSAADRPFLEKIQRDFQKIQAASI